MRRSRAPCPNRSSPAPARPRAPAPPSGVPRRQHDAPDTSGALHRLCQLPDGPEREALRQEVIAAWIPMAERLAYRFRNRGEALEDLQQVAALGLVNAVDRYDPERGSSFPSYAIPTVMGEIRRHFRDHLWGLHVPRRVQELRNKVRASELELLPGAASRGPTVAEIAAHSGLTEDEVLLGMEAINSFSTLSLDAELPGSEGCTLIETLGTTDIATENVIDRESVKPCLRRLPPRERQILYLRFFHDMTQDQIAHTMGMSQMHVSRLISRICAQLRQEVLLDI